MTTRTPLDSMTITWPAEANEIDIGSDSFPEQMAAVLKAVKERAAPYPDVSVISLRPDHGGSMEVLNYSFESMTIACLMSHGFPLWSVVVDEGIITLYKHHTGTAIKKVWQRYWFFEAGYVWRVTYNENPIAPKHIRSGFPTNGEQFIVELSYLVKTWLAKKQTPNRLEMKTLDSILSRTDWKQQLSEETVIALREDHDHLTGLFSGLYEPTTVAVKVALEILDEHLAVRGTGQQSFKVYQDMIEACRAGRPYFGDMRGIRDT